MTPETFDLTENPFLASIQTAHAYNAKLFKFAANNVGAVFKYAEKLSSVRSSPEFADLLTNHARDQFDLLTEQVEELSALAQKAS